MKCSICEEIIKKTEAYFGDKGTIYENKPLCESCYYEDEPCATVFYKKDEQPYVVSHTRNETDEDFSVSWHSTDPWRGYYETKSDKYNLVNTAELLSYHESEKMLKLSGQFGFCCSLERRYCRYKICPWGKRCCVKPVKSIPSSVSFQYSEGTSDFGNRVIILVEDIYNGKVYPPSFA